MKIKTIYCGIALLVFSFSACKNQDWEFPDYDYQSVYFAYQSPIRTLTLGEDIFDTSLDNEHKFMVMATTAGVYNNLKDIRIDFEVDNSLTDDIVFGPGGTAPAGAPIEALPQNYYTLASNSILIPKGSLIGGVEIQLTDAFFADPKSLSTNYVLPIRMTGVSNADTILSGRPIESGSLLRPTREEDWEIVPKNYTLYAIKYINTWHGNYLRRGVDNIDGKNGRESLTQRIVRNEGLVERDEVVSLHTQGLQKLILPLTFANVDQTNINLELILTFDSNNNCSISSGTSGVNASGTGSFVKRGDKNSWGNTDRDVLYLAYEIDMDAMHVSSKDTLVMRDRGVKMETFVIAPKEQ